MLFPKAKWTPYERYWCVLLVAVIACFIAETMNMSTAIKDRPIVTYLFWLEHLFSAVLLIYSISLFKKLPRRMIIIGTGQVCMFFPILTLFLFNHLINLYDWICKIKI